MPTWSPVADDELAEDAMWQWYLEWSTIARTVIDDRRLLRALGFLKRSRNATSSQDDANEDVEGNDDAPATEPTPSAVAG